MPTKSQILGTDPQKVLDLIDGWKTTVATLERQAETYLGYVQRPGGSSWEGQTAEAAQSRARGDLQAAARVHDALDAAARQIANNVSANLIPPLANAKQIIANAEANSGVRVNEDLSISYTPPEGMGTETVNANRKTVADAEVELKAEAAKWWAAENDVADHIRDAESIVNTSSGPGRGKRRIQLVDRHGPLPQDPALPTDPQMTTEQARSAYNQLKNEIATHNASPPPLNDANAVSAYNQHADALNAKKHALEAQLGRSEPVTARASRLTPDWAQPWHPPEHPPRPVPPGPGPGTWQTVNESMSERSAHYQMQITGRPITDSYVVNGVKFDDFRDGTLIDCKSYYDQFIENGHWKPWFTGEHDMLSQAYNQIRVAGGTPVEWVCAQPGTAALLESLLSRYQYDIRVVVIPPQ